MTATKKMAARSTGNGRQDDFLSGIPPHDPEMEMAVLGSIMFAPDKLDEVIAVIGRDDFHDMRNAYLFEHFLNMPVEVLTDRTARLRWLLDAGDLEACGGHAHIGEIADAVGSCGNALYYAGKVRELAHRRRLIESAVQVAQAAYTGSEGLADLAIEFRDKLDRHVSAPKDRYTLRTAGEVAAAEHSVEFFIEPLLVKRMPCVLGGPSKSLKSTVAFDLGVSIATATKFLGHFWTPEPARVAIFSAESGLAAIGSIIRRICAARDLDPDDVGNLLVSGDLPRLDRPDHLLAVRKVIEANEIDLVILDPLYLLAPTANASRLHEMGALFRGANEVCHETGATMLLVHHSVKRPGQGTREQFTPPEREDLHGAGVVEWARQWIQLARRQPYEPGSGRHALWFSVGGSAGHGGLWAVDADEGQFDPKERSLEHWVVDVRSGSDERRERVRKQESAKAAAAQEKLAADCRDIIEVMSHMDGAQPRTAIRDATFGGQRFNAAWNELLKTGSIVPAESGVKRANGQTYTGYRVAKR